MELLNEKYQISSTKLGSGGFSEVFLGKNLETNQDVAIKKVPLVQENMSIDEIQRKLNIEVEVMQKFDHPNIVKYYDVIKTSNFWYIVMEYCNSGTLENVIEYNKKKYHSVFFNREANTHYYLNQLKEALNHIRNMGYIHRDIKPMNILLTKFPEESDESIFKSDEQPQIISKKSELNLDLNQKIIVKLADFGLAKYSVHPDSMLMNTRCGSPLYMAPEIFQSDGYDSKADLWSFGIVMYQMLFGENPSYAQSLPQLVKKITTHKIKIDTSKNYTSYCYDLLERLLEKKSDERISWSHFFGHDWFSYWDGVRDNLFAIKKISNPINLIEPIESIEPCDSENSDSANSTQKKIPITASKPIKINYSSRMSHLQGFPYVSPCGSPGASPDTSASASPSTSPTMSSMMIFPPIGPFSCSSSPLGHSNLSRIKPGSLPHLGQSPGGRSNYSFSYPPNHTHQIQKRSSESRIIGRISRQVSRDGIGWMDSMNSIGSIGSLGSVGSVNSIGLVGSMNLIDSQKMKTSQNKIQNDVPVVSKKFVDMTEFLVADYDKS